MEERWAWLVIGSAGEYADFQQWPVAVYTSEGPAIEHAERAGVCLRKMLLTRKGGKGTPYDPESRLWYDTEYRVEKVPLVGHVSEFLGRAGS